MPRTSKTEYAVLGLLAMQPMSGYDIKTFIAGSIGFFWQESYGQIYPALKRMRANRLVTRKISKQKGHPDRHIYEITPAGRERLSEWLAADLEAEPVRVELLLKMFFGTMAPVEDIIRNVECLLKQQQSRMKIFNNVRKHEMPQYQDLPEYPFWLSTLSFGEHVTRARIRWCRETLAWLKNHNRKKTSRKIRNQ